WARAEEVRRFASGTDRFAYAPDGMAIATVKWFGQLPKKLKFDFQSRKEAGVIQFWDPATGAQRRTISLGDVDRTPLFNLSLPLAFSPDGKTLAAFTGESIMLVAPDTGKTIRKMTLPARPDSMTRNDVHGMVFANNTRLYTCNYGGHVYEWEV